MIPIQKKRRKTFWQSPTQFENLRNAHPRAPASSDYKLQDVLYISKQYIKILYIKNILRTFESARLWRN